MFIQLTTNSRLHYTNQFKIKQSVFNIAFISLVINRQFYTIIHSFILPLKQKLISISLQHAF